MICCSLYFRYFKTLVRFDFLKLSFWVDGDLLYIGLLAWAFLYFYSFISSLRDPVRICTVLFSCATLPFDSNYFHCLAGFVLSRKVCRDSWLISLLNAFWITSSASEKVNLREAFTTRFCWCYFKACFLSRWFCKIFWCCCDSTGY